MPKPLKNQEGSKEELELKKQLAAKVNQGADLKNPVKLNQNMPDLGKGTDAEKNVDERIMREESEDKPVEHKSAKKPA